jgi:tetratricopeptide (TPR) repeat protein
MRRPRIAGSFATSAVVFLLVVAVVGPPAAAGEPSQVSAATWAAKAHENFYSLEFREAIANLERAAALEPDEALHRVNIADAHLFLYLYLRGELDRQLYTASNAFMEPKPPLRDERLIERMHAELALAREIAERRLRENPRDAAALYALGMADAVETNYLQNAVSRTRDAVRIGTRGKNYHERALEIDPGFHDAKLLVGFYEYVIGSLPTALRWIVRLLGHSGSKERGLTLIYEAIEKGRRSTPAGLTLLSIIYNHERRYGEARIALGHLHRFYPRNFYFEMEQGLSFAREGNWAGSAAMYLQVERRRAEGAPGYDRLDPPRLWFQIGHVLERAGKPTEAAEWYERAIAAEAADRGMRAEALIRLGDIHRAAGRADAAREAYRQAEQSGSAAGARKAAARLRALR